MYSEKDIRDICKEQGYKLLKIEQRSHKVLHIKDKKGYKYIMWLSNLKKGKQPLKFSTSNIYTIENIKKYIELNNLDIILKSQNYTGRSDVFWECCKCGKVFKRSLTNALYEKKFYCLECCYKVVAKKNRHNIDFVKSELNNYGYKLLDKTYLNSETNLNIIDKEGYKYYTSYNQLREGHLPIKFNTCNPYTIDNIKNYITRNKIKVELLSEIYSGSLDCSLIFKCKSCTEEHLFTTSLFSFLYQNKRKCNFCVNKDLKIVSKDDVELVLSSNGFVFENKDNWCNLEDEIIGIDSEGYKYLINYGNLKNNIMPMKFYESNPYSLDNIKTYIKNNNLKVEYVKGNYGTKIEWKCECGKHFKAKWNEVYCLDRTRCTDCSNKKSKISLKVREWLIDNKIEFKEEYIIPECKYKRALPFDYAIFKNNKLFFLIEVDGSQHFAPTTFYNCNEIEKYERFFYQVIRDKTKDNYCKSNNIKLLRLPYWYFKNDKYKIFLEQSILE